MVEIGALALPSAPMLPFFAGERRGLWARRVARGYYGARQELRGSCCTLLRGERVKYIFNVPVWSAGVQRKESIAWMRERNRWGRGMWWEIYARRRKRFNTEDLELGRRGRE